MKKCTIKFITVLAVTALITACSMFSPVLADAGFVPVQESVGFGGEENLMLPEEETSFNGEVAAVIVAALVLCGVVIVVVNNRSKRK